MFLRKFYTAVTLAIATVALACAGTPAIKEANAATSNSHPIVVSLGDSYSSGEGIEPFYDQDKGEPDKWHSKDFLAHRSEKSWPGQLQIPDGSTWVTLSEVKEKGQWKFAAASGAETKHIFRERQSKSHLPEEVRDKKLSYQIKAIEDAKRNGDIAYVTLTIGGNDVGFGDIISMAAMSSSLLEPHKLSDELDNRLKNLDIAAIEDAYASIRNTAGDGTHIIVAGYPKLFDESLAAQCSQEGSAHYYGNGPCASLFSPYERQKINEKIPEFNKKLEEAVERMKTDKHKVDIYDDNEKLSTTKEIAPNEKIYFVDVVSEFEGHGEGSDEPWISGLKWRSSNDIVENVPQDWFISRYSFHPNEEGAKAYARAVQAQIDQIENEKLIQDQKQKAKKNPKKLTGANGQNLCKQRLMAKLVLLYS